MLIYDISRIRQLFSKKSNPVKSFTLLESINTVDNLYNERLALQNSLRNQWGSPEKILQQLESTLSIFSCKLNPQMKTGAHAIIVFGVPANQNGSLTKNLQNRVDAACALAKANSKALVLVTGSHVQNRYVEARIMAAELVRQGIQATRILIEDQAHTTLTNVYYALKLLRKYELQHAIHFSQLTLVAEPYHLPRVSRAFHAGLAASGIQHPITVQLKGCERVSNERILLNKKLQISDDIVRCIEEKRRVMLGY